MRKLFVIFSLLFVSANVQAALLTGLLQGGDIIAADKRFHGFEVLFEDSSDFRTFDYDNFELTGLADGDLDPGPGIAWNILNDQMRVEGDGINAYADFQVGFWVTVLDPGFLIKDNSLEMNGASYSAGLLASNFIEEKVFNAAGDLLGTKSVEFSNFATDLYDEVEFAPVSSVWVTVNMLVEAIDLRDFANLNSFEQRFSQTERIPVPEPSALALLAAGLVLLRVRKR